MRIKKDNILFISKLINNTLISSQCTAENRKRYLVYGPEKRWGTLKCPGSDSLHSTAETAESYEMR